MKTIIRRQFFILILSWTREQIIKLSPNWTKHLHLEDIIQKTKSIWTIEKRIECKRWLILQSKEGLFIRIHVVFVLIFLFSSFQKVFTKFQFLQKRKWTIKGFFWTIAFWWRIFSKIWLQIIAFSPFLKMKIFHFWWKIWPILLEVFEAFYSPKP